MTPQQKKLILQFMRIILDYIHPNIDEYPIDKMEQCLDLESAIGGTGFENTSFWDADGLIQAFWMNRIIKQMEEA